MRRSGCPTKGENLGGLPESQKVCWISPPPKNWVHLFSDHTSYIQVSLTAFRKILSKTLPEACIFSNLIMTYLEKFIGTKSIDTKQYLAGLSPRIIPHYFPKHLLETLEMEKNHTQQPKIYSFPQPEKNPLGNLLL